MPHLPPFILVMIVLLGSMSSRAQSDTDTNPFKHPAYLGRMACDERVVVTITEDKKQSHRYDITVGKAQYKTQRVATQSGAIRLEDKARGVVWLQMANKSMLFNEKAGKRLANNCRNEVQTAAEQVIAMSNAPTVLDGLNTK